MLIPIGGERLGRDQKIRTILTVATGGGDELIQQVEGGAKALD